MFKNKTGNLDVTSSNRTKKGTNKKIKIENLLKNQPTISSFFISRKTVCIEVPDSIDNSSNYTEVIDLIDDDIATEHQPATKIHPFFTLNKKEKSYKTLASASININDNSNNYSELFYGNLIDIGYQFVAYKPQIASSLFELPSIAKLNLDRAETYQRVGFKNGVCIGVYHDNNDQQRNVFEAKYPKLTLLDNNDQVISFEFTEMVSDVNRFMGKGKNRAKNNSPSSCEKFISSVNELKSRCKDHRVKPVLVVRSFFGIDGILERMQRDLDEDIFVLALKADNQVIIRLYENEKNKDYQTFEEVNETYVNSKKIKATLHI